MDERLRNGESGQPVAKVGKLRSRLPQLVEWAVWRAKREQFSVSSDPRALELTDQPQHLLGRLKSELIARSGELTHQQPALAFVKRHDVRDCARVSPCEVGGNGRFMPPDREAGLEEQGTQRGVERVQRRERPRPDCARFSREVGNPSTHAVARSSQPDRAQGTRSSEN